MGTARGRRYQDSVFRMYFNNEQRLKELAGALHGKVYAEEDRLEIVTLDGTFLSQIKNDVSFLLAGRYLIFLEHQSTPNENMPLRCLYYVCEQFRKDIDPKLLYRNYRVRLPAPEFHVFYTGEQETPERYELKLSDAYAGSEQAVNLELKVLFHNVGYAEEKNLLRKSRSLRDYAHFIRRVKENMAQGQVREQAIREAIRYCMAHDIMKDFLGEHEREVIDMVGLEWNQKLFEEAKYEEGLERGRASEKIAVVLGMLKEKLPLDMIARVSELSLDRVKEVGRMHSLL